MIAVRRSSLLATILVLTVSAFAAASDELARAKDLCRSASCDEALVAPDQMAHETSVVNALLRKQFTASD